MIPESGRTLLIGAGVLLAYVAAGKLGLSLAFVNPSASPVWPPTGIAVGALILFGYRLWPAVLLGAFLVNFTTVSGPLASLSIATGNTLEAVAGAWLANRYAGGRAAFSSSKNVFLFTALVAVLATVLSATVGVATLAASGSTVPEEIPGVWLTWWLGDAAGALLVAPILVLGIARSRGGWVNRRRLEAVAMLGANVLVATAVFRNLSPVAGISVPTFVCLVPLTWAVFRFGPRETAATTLVIAAIAVYGTADSLGPFAYASPNDSLLLLQSFMAILAAFALSSAATVEERKRADATREERLQVEEIARQRAEDLNRARDQFLATVSHELRTPLNAMLAWVVLARSEESNVDVMRSALEVFERNIRRQIRLVEDLLDISHMNAGEFEMESRLVRLRPVLDAAANSVRPLAEEKNVRITTRGDDTAVDGDPDRLEQVIVNLLSNAVRVTPEGGDVELTLDVFGGEAVMRVSDSGPGIPPGFRPFLFEPFRQADSPATRRHGGLGLGLSIVRHLVQAHGGTVTADSGGDGGGATFTVRLPLADGRQQSAADRR